MSKSLSRYARAFIGAVRMTLRGEKLPTDQEKLEADFPVFSAWMREAIRLVTEVESAIKAAGIDSTTLIVNIDKRRTNAKTILETVRYHHAEEYPYLMKHQHDHTLTGVHATNLNDRYAVLMLAQNSNLPDASHKLLSQLRDHLDTIPT